MSILTVENVKKIYGEKAILNSISLGIEKGEKIGIIGVNGTGKSTLLKLIAGREEADSGNIITSKNITTEYLPQTPVFDGVDTVLEYVIQGKHSEVAGWSIESEAKNILNRLGLVDYDNSPEKMSGGERKRAALARCLVSPADIILLDEPTNHLDANMIMWLEEYLIKSKSTIIMVTHDRYFLDKVTNKIIELDKGNIYEYNTNYSGFLSLKAKRIEEMISAERKRQNTYRTELEWVRRGAQARSTKQKARLQRFEELKNISAPKLEEKVELESIASRIGKKTIELDNITKSYGDRCIIRNFTYFTVKNDRLGIVGENGCGKSTLLKIIQGIEKPDEGSVTIGDTVKIGYFAQECQELQNAKPSEKVIDYIRDTAEFIETPSGKISASQMLERFLFSGVQQWTQINKLSGGEKRRLYLLKVLMTAPNVLILDEPTNDLDIATLTILEDFLDSFAGIVITVSHDRYFLDNVVDRIIAFEDNGLINQYDGNYSDYIEKSGLEVAAITARNNVSKKTDEESKSINKSSEGNIRNTWKTKDDKPKFTYSEKKEYETIEEDIEKIEILISDIDDEMVKFSRDFVKLGKLNDEKNELEEKLNHKMERWEYLSELADRIERFSEI